MGSGHERWGRVGFLVENMGKGKGWGGWGGGVGTGKGTGKSMCKFCRNYPLANYPLASPRFLFIKLGVLFCTPNRRHMFDHDEGQKSAISGRRLHWRLSTGFLSFFSSIYVQFSKTSPLKSGESSKKSSGENRVKSCHVCGCHGFFPVNGEIVL